MLETWVWSLDQEAPLEKETTTHSSALAWRSPWMEEPGGLQSMGSRRVGHDWATSLSLFLSLAVERGLWGARASLAAVPGFQGTRSVAVGRGFGCSKTCAIFPDQRLNRLSAIGRRNRHHRASREAQIGLAKDKGQQLQNRDPNLTFLDPTRAPDSVQCGSYNRHSARKGCKNKCKMTLEALWTFFFLV